jgi:predicted secreted hydrolase
LISPQGAATQLDGQQIGFETLEFSLLHGRQLPVRWRITLTEIGREMIITPLLEDQWMDVDFAYWEGAIQAAGPTAGSTGRGYLEMTGYGAGQ